MRAPLPTSPSRTCSFVGSIKARSPCGPVQSDASIRPDFEKIDLGGMQSLVVVISRSEASEQRY